MAKFPNVEVQLSDEDGNAFSIISRAARAMRQAGIDDAEIEAYRQAAMSGDYDNVLRVTMETVSTA